MTITLSRGRPSHATALTCLPALFAQWLARLGGVESLIGHLWSAEDILMVIAWVLAMPFAAMRFERAIIAPPFAHLSAGGSFVAASAEALLELAVAAVLARAFAATMRRAARRLAWRLPSIGFFPRHDLQRGARQFQDRQA